jgi:thiol-disulfide isomerase/thioredoxin
VNIKSMVAALALAFLIPVSQGHAQAPSPAQASANQKHGQPSAPAVQSLAPDFGLQSVKGETVRLSDFRGKVVLVNFWATWCGPCKILTPWFVELQNQYGPQGLVILGVALDEDATKMEIAEFADSMQVNYAVLIGNEKVAKAYGGVPAMPESFFIGRDGKVLGRIIGLKSKGEIEDSIKKALDAQTGNPEAAAPSAPSAQAQK